MLLAACLAALPAPHAGQPPPQLTPRAVYDRLLGHYAGAAATDFAFTFTMAGSDEQVEGTSRFALPLHGRFALSSVNQNLVAIADGERLALLAPATQTYMEAPDGLGSLPFLTQLAPFRAWLPGEDPVPRSLALVELSPPNSQVQVLEADFGEWTETLWVGGAGNLLAARIVSPLGENDALDVQLSFSRAEALAEVRLEDFVQSLPAGYRSGGGVADSLPPVGSLASDVTLTTLDGVELNLTDLEGKTLLLNFWFYY